MTTSLTAGDDHCRVTKPEDSDDAGSLFEYFRHLFPYAEAARRIPGATRVLDVGCGAGYGTQYLSATVSDITGTDMSEQALAYAQANYPGIRFVPASGDSLPFASASFDAVVSFQVIEHIADAKAYVRELHRVIRPGGLLYLTTPNRRLRLLPFQRPWNPYHMTEYRDTALAGLVRSVFPDVRLSGVMAGPEHMRSEISRVSQNPFRVLMRVLSRRWPSSARKEGAAGSSPPGLNDFFLANDTKGCLDLFVAAHKAK